MSSWAGAPTPNFSRVEFACPCCGLAPIDQGLVRNLQLLRNILGRPLIVTSGFRCLQHNTAVGGSTVSQHTLGTAADLRIPPGMSSEELYDLAKRLGVFRGLGLYHTHVHVDMRDSDPSNPPTEWDYRR